MSALQWALLILSVIVVFALVAASRREKTPGRRGRSAGRERQSTRPPSPEADADSFDALGDQMDIFGAPAEPEAGFLSDEPAPAPQAEREVRPDVRPEVRAEVRPEARGPGFDEFGVGRPRKRIAPDLQAAASAPAADTSGSLLNAEPPPAEPRETAQAASPEAPNPPTPQKIMSLLVAEREGTAILGEKIHRALQSQGLKYGARQIYHRINGEAVVFSVASLVKPGILIPEDAASFSTPGLSLFMILPGPIKPVVALLDMVSTAQALARALNAEVYDANKQPLTQEGIRAVLSDVEDWSRSAGI